ncbi:MAG TPA: MATE family efflux transporter [Arenimonas sp.]|uniref:MATE family efflux transporter n=1 Tax=Arenimonas sp. TaxID=1872635 RepID=UPI002B60C7F3|nr:MATE family efflux transporter [Arenimonas sp.]HMB56228.1 MATE family efflux transporter [Arenimonas sp.]
MSHTETFFARGLREMRVSFFLALPLAAGQLAAMAMSLVDSLLAGRHGSVTLAAVAVGSALWTIALLLCIGVLMAVPPLVSQLNGGGRRHEIGPLWRQAVWLALAMGVVLGALVYVSPLLLDAFGIAAEVRPQAADFLHAIAIGAPALALYFCFRYLSEGIAWTLPTMLFGIGGLLLLIPLGYALMFGFGPVPELGAAGLGYATALVLWLQAAGFFLYLRLSPRFAELALFARFDRPRWPAIRDLLALGLPMGVSVFMEGSLFVMTALLIGRLGAIDVAAHQIALNVASMCFMLPLGLAMATTVRVGHAAGADDRAAVRWAAGAGYALVLVTQTAAALLLIFAGRWITGFYTDDPRVATLAVTLMFYAAVFQYPDGIQALSAGALRGLKDTRVPMIITILAYWGIGLSLGAWFGLHQGGRAPGLWLGLIVGLSAAAGLLGLRFWRIARRG